MNGQNPVFQLVYASAATVAFNEKDLEELLAKARKNNQLLGVTGILLYHDGSFIQALEGERQTVLDLYEKIMADPRHASGMLLYRGEVQERCFADWSMGFQRLRAGEVRSIPGLSDFLSTGRTGLTAEDGQRIRAILIGFRDGKWRRHAS